MYFVTNFYLSHDVLCKQSTQGSETRYQKIEKITLTLMNETGKDGEMFGGVV